jgi:nucleoside 2-deoxyribosyltransferase
MSDVKVFVSYSRRDAAVAEKISQALRGIKVLTTSLDTDVKPGDDFRKAIFSSLKSSDAVLAIATSPDVASHSWTGYEIGAAEALRKPIILMTSDRYSLSEFPESLASYPVVVFNPEQPERAAREIAERLSSYLVKS